MRKWAGCEPLNLGYIASYLESKKFQVRIFDQLAGQDIKKNITYFKPDVAGLTATTPLAGEAYKIANFLKKQGILTVMGGIHASVLPEDALNHDIDVVVKGPGETAMADIIEQGIKSGVIDGILPKNLDDIPKPARHLMSLDFYLKTPKFVPNYSFVPPGQKSARMITSRGCIYKCIFCHNVCRKTRLLLHSPERVIDEVEEISHNYNTKYIFLMDDNFLVVKKRLIDICSLILSKEIKFSWSCQATSNEIDEGLLPLLKKAGCKQMLFGIESGSQKILDILQKRTNVEKNSFALRKVKENGILVQCYFIVGNPNENEQDLYLTKKFILDNKKYIDTLLVSFLTPFPGTKLWDDMQRLNRIPPPQEVDWSKVRYDSISFPVNQELNPKILQRFYFELLSLMPPNPSTIFYRFLSDPIGVLANVAKTDKKVILSTLYRSFYKLFMK